MVEIQKVSKSFKKTVKDSTAEIKALAEVSLSIREKEFISITGPSGCGKTTLLKIIDGLIPYDSARENETFLKVILPAALPMIMA